MLLGYTIPILKSVKSRQEELYATLLLISGVNPKVVSERLGHSSISVTLDTYSHVLPCMQEEAAAKLNNLMLNSSKVKLTADTNLIPTPV